MGLTQPTYIHIKWVLCIVSGYKVSKLMSHVTQPHPLDWKLAPSFQSMAEGHMAKHAIATLIFCKSKKGGTRVGTERPIQIMAASLYGDKSSMPSSLEQISTRSTTVQIMHLSMLCPIYPKSSQVVDVVGSWYQDILSRGMGILYHLCILWYYSPQCNCQ